MATSTINNWMVEIKLMSIIISFILGANVGFLLASIIASGKEKE